MNQVFDIFEANGFELKLVGGAVRDKLLGKIPNDYDFATTATPHQMKEMFDRSGIKTVNKNGEKHGTITCKFEDTFFEITTLRIDVQPDGRRCEKVEFISDFALDASRRDFTINAMYMDKDETIYDYFEGKSHLNNKLIRFVGNPVSRIKEDYLRILRYFRLFAQISAENHEPETLIVISQNVDGLSNISGERIWIEMKKIMKYANIELIELMIDLKILEMCGFPKFLVPQYISERFSPLIRIAALLNYNDLVVLRDRVKMSKKEFNTMKLYISAS